MRGAEAQIIATDLLFDLEKVMSGIELRSSPSLPLPRGAAVASRRCCRARAPPPGSSQLVVLVNFSMGCGVTSTTHANNAVTNFCSYSTISTVTARVTVEGSKKLG